MNWMSIEEYARKYQISTSTIRRRIWGKMIKVKMVKGKYLILESPETKNQLNLYTRHKKALFRECPLCGRA